MKHYKKKEIPAQIVEKLDFYTCDWCKKQYKLEAEPFSVDEIEIRHKTGVEYPEGGHGGEVQIDLCPDCFDNRLVPLLQSQGCDVHEQEWEWG